MADLFNQTEDVPVEGDGADVEASDSGEPVAAASDGSGDGPSFESALKELEEAVEKLEEGNLSLSDALKLFEDGLKASNTCRSRLEEAKQKVELLVSRNGDEFRLRDVDLDEV